jgi:hypothetical protein
MLTIVTGRRGHDGLSLREGDYVRLPAASPSQIQCARCDFSVPEFHFGNMESHVNVKHKRITPWHCKLCAWVECGSKKSLRGHWRSHHMGVAFDKIAVLDSAACAGPEGSAGGT